MESIEQTSWCSSAGLFVYVIEWDLLLALYPVRYIYVRIFCVIQQRPSYVEKFHFFIVLPGGNVFFLTNNVPGPKARHFCSLRRFVNNVVLCINYMDECPLTQHNKSIIIKKHMAHCEYRRSTFSQHLQL